MGRATIVQGYRFPNIVISIHALRGEGDVEQLGFSGAVTDISIHALRGEGDPTAKIAIPIRKNFNPRPPWGGRHGFVKLYNKQKISIHALRGEGDFGRL